MPSIILSDNGVSSGSAGLKSTAASDGALSLQTTTAGGTATTAISIDTSQNVSFTNQPTYSGGTANGVAYLNGSKVLTTGSALVFDGTNLGVGVTPATYSGSGVIGFNIANTGNGVLGNSSNVWVSNNVSFNSGFKYARTSTATLYNQSGGAHTWSYAASGTAGNAITFTDAMTLDASGRLLVNTTSATSQAGISGAKLQVLGGAVVGTDAAGTGGSGWLAFNSACTFPTTAKPGAYHRQGVGLGLYSDASMSFEVNGGTEAARIDSSNNLLVGTTSGSNHIIYKNAAVASRIIAFQGENSGAYTSVAWATADNQGWNGANTVQIIGKNTGTGRSINAAGTVNASGADYAEYMTKADDFTIAKGDVVGINAQGKLTNVFADAISFAVKSTDPSYVGGDVWGSEEALGLTKPTDESTQEEKDAFNAALEAARQRVDRIAFAGQVPVNVMGATAGQYIIPVNDNGAIKGEAVSNPTFEQYQTAVGKVIAIESDGRAKIIVKVA